MSRRAFVAGAGAASVPRGPAGPARSRRPSITYWNGLTGADGKVMDELIDQFTRDSGIRIEQQRLPWADLYAKLQVAVPGRRGPRPGPHPHRRGSPLRERRRARGHRRRRRHRQGLPRRGLPARDVAGRHLPGQALLAAARRAPAHPLHEREGDEGRRPRRTTGGRACRPAATSW